MNHAHAAESTKPPVPKEFVEKLVAAWNTHDIDKMTPLFHPEFAKCVTEENKSRFAYGLWWGRKADVIAPGYSFMEESVDKDTYAVINDEVKNPYAKYQTFPVLPDTSVRIDYKRSELSSVSKLFRIKWEGSTPYLVDGCPTPLGVQEFDRKRASIEEQKTKAKSFWDALDEKKKGGIKDGFKSGNAVVTMKLLEDAEKLSPTEANIIRMMIEDGDL